ncbi:MAG: YraN family protein [Pseudomonadota bacterium]
MFKNHKTQAEKAPLNRRELGGNRENQARSYLEREGLVLVEANYSAPCGEIDLIMRDANQRLIFVEVRHRSSGDYGGAAASIGPRKQQRLYRTALHYLQKHHLMNHPCRIDVVAIEGDRVQWIPNALDGF